MNSYNLGGHSGCLVYLMEDDDGNAFIRKVSRDLEYNERLRAQCRKQQEFHRTPIQVPTVRNEGYTEAALYYFDMEYIPGITLSEYIKTMEIGKIQGLVEILTSGLINRNVNPPDSGANKIFLKKFSILRRQLENLNNPIIHKALDMLEAHDWSVMTVSPCHGDLTLENIIVKDDRLYFIDFLDSFYNSWFLDVGTLLQDVQTMWSYRFEKNVNMNTVLRLIVFRDLLLDRIREENTEYVREAYYALLQKLVRIYPYTKDDATYHFLNEKTRIVMDDIRKLEGTGILVNKFCEGEGAAR